MTKRDKGRKNDLEQMTQRGFRGYPIATVAFYGPTSKIVTKIVASVFMDDDHKISFMEKWYPNDTNVEMNDEIRDNLLAFINKHNVKSVVVSDGVMGCPHEEGIDYPEGESCPQCPYWENRDRFLDEVVH